MSTIESKAFSADMMTPKSVSMVFGIFNVDYLKRSRRPNGPPGPDWYEKAGRVLYAPDDVIAFIGSLKKSKNCA